MSWRDVGFLVAGLFVGANVGLLILALCVAAGTRNVYNESCVVTNPDPDTNAPVSRVLNRNVPVTQEWVDDAVVNNRVVFERKTVVTKRCFSPRPPNKKPYGPPPSPPPGKSRQRIENE